MPRKTITTLTLALLGMSLIGCSVERSPLVTVAPSYSYVQAQPHLAAGDIWPVQSTLRASNAEDVPVAINDATQYTGRLSAGERTINPSRVD